jgi:hypothetical protein
MELKLIPLHPLRNSRRPVVFRHLAVVEVVAAEAGHPVAEAAEAGVEAELLRRRIRISASRSVRIR